MNSESFYDDSLNEIPANEKRATSLRDRKAEKRSLLQTRLSMISLTAMALFLLLAALFLLVFPRSEKSQIEKRELAKFPSFSLESYFSGAFTSGVTTFYDDTVPYRDNFKNLSNEIKNVFGMKLFSASGSANVSSKEDDEDAENAESSATPVPTSTGNILEGVASRNMALPAASAADESYQRDYTAEENGSLEWVNNLLMVNWDGHWRCMEPFGGGSGSDYVDALNELQSLVSQDVTIWSMPAPTSSAIYTPKNAIDYVADQGECFDEIAAKLNPGIRSVNVVDVMRKHTEENIYCRTDHHWQPRGAYYAARTFAEAADVPFTDISSYTSGYNEGFVGTMYGFSQDSRLLNDPEDFVYYVPSAKYQAYYYDSSFNYQFSDDLFAEVDVANSYLMFMGGDSWVVKVDTEVKNGRKLLVVKDSFGNAEIPYYTSSFEQIYVVDVREFQRNLVNFIDTTGVTDVLFTMSAYSVVGDNASNITNLIHQDADSKIVDEHPTDNTASSTPAPDNTTSENSASSDPDVHDDDPQA